MELEAPALLPLPLQRYEMAYFKTVKVHIDYHAEVERHSYSVPYALVRQVLKARDDGSGGVPCIAGSG